MLDPYRTPSTTLDLQLELMAWAEDRGRDHLRLLDATVNRPIIPSRPVSHPGWGESSLNQLAAALHAGLGGWTLWVSGPVVDLVSAAADSVPMPNGSLSAGVIPAPAGMAWCAGEAGLFHDDLPVRALSWTVRLWPMLLLGVGDESPRLVDVPAVVVWPWVEVGDRHPEVRAPITLPLSSDAAAMIEGWDGDLVGRVSHTEEEWANESRAIARWILAAWVMSGQVMPRQVETATRAQRRRATRLPPSLIGPDWGEVHVTTLRRADRDGTDWHAEGPTDGRYSHQWVVSGHWRWQPCGPGGKDRRLKWIAPYVKGPEGAPLIEVEQVGKLVR